jgi:hypothetical protein
MRYEKLARLLCLTAAPTGDVPWNGKSSQDARLEQRAVTNLVAGMAQAAERTVGYPVSSLHDRVLQEAFTSA